VRCRRKDIEVGSGALAAWRRCRDVEEFASRALEMRCRRRDIEVRSSSVLLLLLKFLAFVLELKVQRLKARIDVPRDLVWGTAHFQACAP